MSIVPQSMIEKFTTGDFDWVDIINFLLHLIQLALQLAAIVAVILIMYGGFQYVYGGIDEGSKDAGKKTVMNTIFGLVVILLSWVIVDIVIAFVTGGA